MKNLFTMLEKEKEKSEQIYLTSNGDLFTMEQLEKVARKNYMKDLKTGNIDHISLDEYISNFLDEYIRIEEVEELLQLSLSDILRVLNLLRPKEKYDDIE